MARTDITVQDMSTSANSLNGVTMTGDAGIADGHQFLITGREVILVTKTSTTGDITLLSPGTAGRDPITDRAITVTTAALPMVISNLPCSTYAQADGKCYVDYEGSEESEFTIQVFRIPNAR